MGRSARRPMRAGGATSEIEGRGSLMLHGRLGRLSLPPVASLLAPLLAISCTWGAEPPAGPRGEPALVVTVPAKELALQPRQTQRLDAQARATDATPPGTSLALGYRSADSCVAAVSADGVVTAGRVGSTVVEAFALAAPLTARAAIDVRVPNLFGPSVALSAITAGDPPVLVDITQPIGGTFVVTTIVAFGYALGNVARLDLLLDGRLAGSAPIPASAQDRASVSIAVNSAARDPVTGAPLFANGARTLRATVVVPPVPGNPGCPPLQLGLNDALITLQLRNP